MPSFHNPYNFVPAPPRAGLPDGLADGPPVGHHRWHDDRWSGDIDVQMTVVTPLLVMRSCPDDCPHRRTGTPAGHRELEVATTPDGLVDLAPTQVKGMLRASFEALTCSRFGVFDGNEPLGFRSVSEGAADLEPALVLARDHVRVLGRIDGYRAAAVVELWGHDRHRKRQWEEFVHGDEVDAVVRRGPHAWEIVSLHRVRTQPLAGHAEGRYLVRGRLHAPGPTIMTKHHETVFVTEILSAGLEQEPHIDHRDGDGERLVTGLEMLIRHQRDVHRPAGGDELWADGRKPWTYEGDEPGKTAWSRHLYDVPDGTHAPDHIGPDTALRRPDRPVTCWAETGNVDRRRRERPVNRSGTRVARLRPVQISRLLHTHPPCDLLDLTLRPADTIDQLSPADRVFGWTRSTRPDDTAAGGEIGPTAHRGQLRVVDLQCPSVPDAIEDLTPLTIPPLSTPKPGQGRFYLGKIVKGKLEAMPPEQTRYDFFKPGDQRLRGRKVYPHHRGLEGRSIEDLRKVFGYQPPVGQHGQRRPEQDTQNATLHQWVRPGAMFRFTLRVTDLHCLELGALLWLLDPERCTDGTVRGRYRLGMGRPLGFGSVELTVTATRLHRGSAIRERLSMLASEPEPLGSDPTPELADQFERALPGWAGPVVEALRWSFAGFPRRAAVHYPSNSRQSPVYEWFTNNDRADGPRQALPLPGSETTLHPVKRT